ncbi:MAG: hypothetical protein Q9M31_05720 [Mariprofundus sp.]|nr:hypothetical protein [Mariprofundus sp.]
MPDAFIWYHGDESLETELLHWMVTVEQQVGVHGKLYRRKKGDTTTFMEAYRDVSSAAIQRIEKMALHQAVFANVNRCCESFMEISP